jgi:hypothetical protein
MAPVPPNVSATVPVQSAVPLEVMVDLQNTFIHHPSFEAWYSPQGLAGDPSAWTLVKAGSDDATGMIPNPVPGAVLFIEFVYHKKPDPLTEAVYLRQHGTVLPSGSIQLTAPGQDGFASIQVTLS